MFITRDKETRNMIDEFETLEEAQDAIKEYEEMDRQDEIYAPDFYEIVERS